ncbi:MAG: MTH938/NDUFAF3 family protein [Patescibacteria group bacterium]|nr:MTH938/NDUFAF3 family protein [Patescibacteria group bacterium]
MINSYHFGNIVIDGKDYHQDVWIDCDNQVHSWWRSSSHLIEKNDLEKAISQKPEIVVIGTGESGVAEVSPDALEFLKKEKIKFFIEPTGQAIKIYNQYKSKNKKVVGLFHLTC